MVSEQAVVVAADLAISLEPLPFLELVFFDFRHMLHNLDAAESFAIDAVMLDEFLMLEHHAVEDLFIIFPEVLVKCLVSFVEGAWWCLIPEYSKITADVLREIQTIVSGVRHEAVLHAFLKGVLSFISKIKSPQPLIGVIALLIFYKFDLMGQNKAWKVLIRIPLNILLLFLATQVERAWFWAILKFFIIAAHVLSVINLIPFGFIVVDALTEVITLPFAKIGVKRVGGLDSHLVIVAIHVRFPRVSMDVNLRREELCRVEIRILFPRCAPGEKVTRECVIIVCLVIAAHDIAWAVKVFTPPSLHCFALRKAVILWKATFVMIIFT